MLLGKTGAPEGLTRNEKFTRNNRHPLRMRHLIVFHHKISVVSRGNPSPFSVLLYRIP